MAVLESRNVACVVILIVALYISSWSRSTSSTRRQGPDYLSHAVSATKTLQRLFYNQSSGLYISYKATNKQPAQLWWNSANCLTALADLNAVDSSTASLVLPILQNSYTQAKKYNLHKWGVMLYSLAPISHYIHPWQETCPKVLAPMSPHINPWQETCPSHVPSGFNNDYNDDGLWWALAWIAAYDLNGEQKFLDTAVQTFQHIAFRQANATCGGPWWDVKHTEQNAITTGLFTSVAAYLANRVQNGQYYLDWALKTWAFFEGIGFIQPSGLVIDGLNNSTCAANTHDASWTYNQGVILGALVELDKARPNATYISIADRIASTAISKLSNENGVLTEYGTNGSPDLGPDGPTFKGVFIRNLRILAKRTGNPMYADYIRKQADSIWTTDLSSSNGTIGNVWDHYYAQLESSGHCSGLDALVAAAAVG